MGTAIKNKTVINETINGNFNNIICTDGTVIRQTIDTNDTELKPDYATNIDIKITDCCDNNCPYCHEGSTLTGKHSNILRESFLYTLHPYQEVALGGGNIFEFPELEDLLIILKYLRVITNITLHQNHFTSNILRLQEYTENKWIYGLGVSLDTPTQRFIDNILKFNNGVIHVINGILTYNQIKTLMSLRGSEDLKILILGYKTLRRGAVYSGISKNIIKNMVELNIMLPSILKHFKRVSFDNLALEQLNVKRYLTEDQWNKFYMGDDGTMTFYIDAVNRCYAKNSSEPLERRYPLLNSVDFMFHNL